MCVCACVMLVVCEKWWVGGVWTTTTAIDIKMRCVWLVVVVVVDWCIIIVP